MRAGEVKSRVFFTWRENKKNISIINAAECAADGLREERHFLQVALYVRVRVCVCVCVGCLSSPQATAKKYEEPEAFVEFTAASATVVDFYDELASFSSSPGMIQ